MSERLRHSLDVMGSWTGALATVTLTQINQVIALLVGVVTIGFTVHRWIYWHRNPHRRNDD